MSEFWRSLPDGVSVAVKVQPQARRPAAGGLVLGMNGSRLRIVVTEVPEDGRANRAACAALARALGVAPSAVAVTAGAGSREKTLRVTGEPAALAARLGGL